MALGFTCLEAGLVRTKNTATICVKNVALYSLAGIMYYLVGYGFMYNDVTGYIGTPALWNPEATVDAGDGYSKMSDWFFQMVFCATAMSIVSGTVAERIIEELDKAAKEGKGAAQLDGRMIDAASARMAENVVNIDKLIKNK